ncbi:MAG: YbhN family protein [bacterium]
MERLLTRQTIKHGLKLFILISLASIVLLIFLTSGQESWLGLRQLRPRYILLAILLIVLSWAFNSLKVKVLGWGIDATISFWNVFKANLGNLFLGAVTPFGMGGVPMQVYILYRGGVGFEEALVASYVGNYMTQVILFITCLGVLIFHQGLITYIGLKILFSFVTFIYLVAFVVGLMAIFKPRGTKRFLGKMGLMLEKRFQWRIFRSRAWLKTGLRGLDRVLHCIGIYFRQARGKLILAVLMAAISLCFYLSTASAILAGLGIHHNFADVLMIQVILQFILYFSPTFGGSGVAEFGAASLMAIFMPTAVLGVYVLLWRFFSYFLAVGLGSVVVLGTIAQK